MIISASYRTDIPAYYAAWFARRLAAGWCLVPGPYGGRPRRVPLADGVDGFVFWTRHVTPLLPSLERLRSDGVPFVVQYTLLGYPRAIEPRRPATSVALSAVRGLAERFGPTAVVWRYDPVLDTSLTDAGYHRRRFGRLASLLAGSVDEVVVSFAQLYRKTTRNLDRVAVPGFAYADPPAAEKQALLGDLRDIAADAGLRLSLCAQRPLLIDGVADAACIDCGRLSRLAGRPLEAERHAHRTACGCWRSVDIGVYHTCPTGCAYCYAVQSRAVAATRRLEHDPADVMLHRPARWRGVATAELLANAQPRE